MKKFKNCIPAFKLFFLNQISNFMRNFIWRTFSLLALSALIFTSCEDTTTDPVDQLPPDIFVSGPSGSVAPSSIIELTIEADRTDNDLKSLEITENGARIDANRFLTFQIGGVDETAQNSILLLGNNVNGLTLVVTFEAPASVGSVDYTAIVEDANGIKSNHTYTLSIDSAPPIITLTNSPLEVTTGQTFFVDVDAAKGDFPMTSMSIFEDGLLVDPARLTWDGAALADNPLSLDVAQGDALFGSLGIIASNVDGFYSFTIQLADGNGTTGEASFDVTVNAGTPIDATLTAQLLSNQAGPAGKGALDLDEGLQAGVSSTGGTTPDQTEIRDLGLDCTIPAPGFNWRRQIGTTNGAEMRVVDLTQVENFSFDVVTTKEEIIGAFDTGIILNDGESVNCANGNTSAVTNVSEVVEVDDLFVVRGSNGTYYLLSIVSVTETGDNNDDYYEISIKH